MKYKLVNPLSDSQGLYIYNALGYTPSGLNAKDYPIQRTYYFASTPDDPSINYYQFIYNDIGLDRNGFDCYGRSPDGYSRNDCLLEDLKRYDEEGYNEKGRDKEGYDREGYDEEGYDRNGYDRDDRNRYGFTYSDLHPWKK